MELVRNCQDVREVPISSPAWMQNYYIQSSGQNHGIVLAKIFVNFTAFSVLGTFPSLPRHFLTTFLLFSRNIGGML